MTLNTRGRKKRGRYGFSDWVIRLPSAGESNSRSRILKQLERRLAQETGRKAEAINAGVPGYGLNHYYIYLKNIGIKYQPDVIVISYFVDDLPMFLKEELAPYEEDFPDRLQYKGGLLHRSRFYNFITSAAAVIRVRNHATAVDHMRIMEVRRAAWARYDHPLINEGSDEKIALLKEYLTRFKALADGVHARLVIMFIPDISHLYHPEYQHINRVLKRLTTQYDIPFVDMTPIFESSNDLSTYYLFPKDAHTNVKGHQAMAYCAHRPDLQRCLVPCLLRKRRPRPCCSGLRKVGNGRSQLITTICAAL